MTDPSLAPPGCGSHYVLAPVPHLGNADIDWAVEGPRYRDRIFDYLEQRYMPGLRSQLVTSRIFTPHRLPRRAQRARGLGLLARADPDAKRLVPRRTTATRDLANLYLVGAGTHPGAGVPGVIGSAKATAGLMLEDDRTMSEALLEHATQTIAVGSKSFAAAAQPVCARACGAAC